jgi:hypothetical protein
MNDRRAVVVGISAGGQNEQGQPTVYTTYSRAKDYAPNQRKMLSFVLVKAKVGFVPERVAQNIRTWWFGPSLEIPLFSAGKLRAGVEIKRTEWEQAVITYRATVLDALREVEDAIIAYQNELRHHDALVGLVDANRRTLTFSRDLYNKGLADFLRTQTPRRARWFSRRQSQDHDILQRPPQQGPGGLFERAGRGSLAVQRTGSARAKRRGTFDKSHWLVQGARRRMDGIGPKRWRIAQMTDKADAGQSGQRKTAIMPRWVKVFGLVMFILLVLFVVLHISGHGFGHHHGD